jgi:ureidoglycolate lyase
MATVHEVKIEPLTDEAFVPFGQIISVKDRAPDFQTASGTRGWAVDFQSGTPLLMLLHTPYQGLSFTKLERHFSVTQTFLPMGGSPAVVAVAPADSGDRDQVPSPSDVRAFLLDGTKGYVLGHGVWHSLDRYALYPPATQWVIITDHETQRNLTAGDAGTRALQLTQEVDFATRFGVTFALSL